MKFVIGQIAGWTPKNENMNNALSLKMPELAPYKERLLSHRLYPLLNGPERVASFMERHVWCVWDFMSLLKALQARLSCVGIPWVPSGEPKLARVINSIVLGEETDEDGRGGYLSHFELYLAAMTDAGADTKPICAFVNELRRGIAWPEALERYGPTPATRKFVRQTLEIATSGNGHEIAAAFALGREDLISPMFLALIRELADREPARFERFYFYLKRHIEVDGDEHGPAALRMISKLCGDDPEKFAGAIETAKKCLETRALLWEEIAGDLG